MRTCWQMALPLVLGAVACDGARKHPAVLHPAGGAAGDAAEPQETNGGGGGGLGEAGSSASSNGGEAMATDQGGATDSLGGAGGEPPIPVSRYCGDAIRDPSGEGCDDGPGEGEDSCTSSCEPRNSLVVAGDRSQSLSRRLGFGSHPLAVGATGAAVVFTELDGSSVSLYLARFNALGQRLGSPIALSVGLSPGENSNPSLAALAGGGYVVCWSDLSKGSLDIVMRAVASDGTLGGARWANSTLAGAQRDADLLWTGTELVAAWTDGLSVKSRRFSAELVPTTDEQTLSTELFAGDVVLARHEDGWAAAFREPAPTDGEQITVVLDDATRFVVGPFAAGPNDERPALVSLDSDHLLLAFDATIEGTSRMSIAVLDRSAPLQVAPPALEPSTPPYDSHSELSQRRPSLTRGENQVFLAWETSSPLDDTGGEELFLRELSWSASMPDGVGVVSERSLLLEWTSAGDQQMPAIAAGKVGYDVVLASVFEHAEALPDSKIVPDIVLGFEPWSTLSVPVAGDSP